MAASKGLSTWHTGLFGVVLVAAAVLGVVNSFKKDVPLVVEQEDVKDEPVVEMTEPVIDERERNLTVPFIAQVPDGAEEASIMMVIAYHDGTQPTVQPGVTIDGLPPGYNAEVMANPTVAQLKQLIDDGYPVIVPVAGQELGNPFYTRETHMLVLRGYTPTEFVTNDPGTQNGENYAYSYDVLLAAMVDGVVVVRPAPSVLP